MSSAGALTADRIGAAAHFDPQLRTPVRPRLRRGITVDIQADQVVIDGIPKRQMFRGALATTLLPAMLPLLDGTRNHAELAAPLEISDEVVFKVASLLWASGVIEEGQPDAVQPDVDPLVADFLSRMGDSTGANASWEEGAAALLAARIEIFGDARLAELLEAEFEGASPVALGVADEPDAATTLVVLVESTDSPRNFAVVDACWRRGIPLVRFRVEGSTAYVGPYIDSANTPCLDCVTAGDDFASASVAGAYDDLAVAILAREVFALVTRSTPSPLPMRWRRLDLSTLVGTELTGATRPGCPRCSVTEDPDGPLPVSSLAVRYEAAVAMPPKAFADVKAHQMHYKPSNLDLQQKFRSWPVAPRVALPEPEMDRLAVPATEALADLHARDLALLLTAVAGVQAITDERVFRWTASGGNIGSVVAHVAVRRCVGVPPGVYAWLPTERALALLSTGLDGVPGDAPATLVLTGDYMKVAHKYAAFALRIVLLDSGCAQATLRAAADSLGLTIAMWHAWDDNAVSAAVGCQPDNEPVTAVIDLGGQP